MAQVAACRRKLTQFLRIQLVSGDHANFLRTKYRRGFRIVTRIQVSFVFFGLFFKRRLTNGRAVTYHTMPPDWWVSLLVLPTLVRAGWQLKIELKKDAVEKL